MSFNAKMYGLGSKRSIIREIFEYSKTRAAEIGAENVFDFSLGNPSVPAPKEVNDTVRELLATESPVLLHGYTSAQGDAKVRQTIAESINNRFGVDISPNAIYMTCGAAASLSICLKAIIENEGEEVIAFAPFFTEYRVFIENAGGSIVISKPDPDTLSIDVADFESRITPNTKAIIMNSPNNPSGVVYSETTVKAVCDVLRKKSAEYGHVIYLIADEPYRELVYTGVEVPYLMNYYDNTLVCYSYSKSLSLPGERIGYILVSPKVNEWKNVFFAVCGAGRALGFVCAPALFQYMVPECLGLTSDLTVYDTNRTLLYDALTEYGYRAIRPDGAFYLFVETPEKDAVAFCEKAKKYELLLVPSNDFGCGGFVRISYCVTTEQIKRSLPAFKALAEEYGLTK